MWPPHPCDTPAPFLLVHLTFTSFPTRLRKRRRGSGTAFDKLQSAALRSPSIIAKCGELHSNLTAAYDMQGYDKNSTNDREEQAMNAASYTKSRADFARISSRFTISAILTSSRDCRRRFAMFIDLKQAFDNIGMPAVWKVLRCIRIEYNLTKFIQLLCSFNCSFKWKRCSEGRIPFR